MADPALNVNMSHTIHPGWEQAFPTYPVYWIFMTVSAVALTGGKTIDHGPYSCSPYLLVSWALPSLF